MLINGPGSAVNSRSPTWTENVKKNRNGVWPTGTGACTISETELVDTTTIEELFRQMAFLCCQDLGGGPEANRRPWAEPAVGGLSSKINLPSNRSKRRRHGRN